VQVCPVPQWTQAAPAAELSPHCVTVSLARRTQVVPAQHPWQLLAVQVDGMQLPPPHVCPASQAMHAASPASDPVPHSDEVSFAALMQVAPAQHPSQVPHPKQTPD
jgi:hypothetical protein